MQWLTDRWIMRWLKLWLVSQSPLSHLPVSVIDRSVVEDWRMEEDRIVLVAYHLDVLMELFLCLEVLSEAFGCPICSDR